MTPEFLLLTFGVVLSLAVSYVPGLSQAYEQLDGMTKRLVMLVGIILVAGAVYALNCAGIAWTGAPDVACTQTGALGVVEAVITTAIANQTAYALTPRRRAAA